MITTVCMNPSFDKTARLTRILPGQVNRLQDVRIDLGGKGVNVAVVISRLGVAARCLACVGQENRTAFMQMAAREKILLEEMPLEGSVRTNLKILEEETGLVTEINEPGPSMQQPERFLHRLLECAADSEYVALSGRLPLNCEPDFYARCIRALSGKKCVLDACGKPLMLALPAKPYLIKPNRSEMEELLGRSFPTLKSLEDGARELMRLGAENVVVSLGGEGALLVTGEECWFAPALSVHVGSTVGAGDAMVGGLLAGLAMGRRLPEAFQCGVAAGAASVMTDGTQLLRREDFENLLPGVRVQRL